MMGYRTKTNGAEFDAISSWRRSRNWRAGHLRYWKRSIRRRARWQARQELRTL
jgi:hypothetical protein